MKLVLLPGMDGTGILFLPLLQGLTPFVEIPIVSYPVDKHLHYPQLCELVEQQLPTNEPFALCPRPLFPAGLRRFSVNTRVTTDDGRPIITPVIQEFASVQYIQ